MNDENRRFEERLQRLPQQPIPAHWREQILRDAQRAAQPPTTAPGAWKKCVAGLLWPHPRAWGALAAAWILILALNFASREQVETVAVREPGLASPQLQELLHQQQQLFAELVGIEPSPHAPRPVPGRPRSQRRLEFAYA